MQETRMLNKYFSALIFLVLPLQINLAQTDSVQTSVDEIIQQLLEESGDETDNSGLIDKIEALADDPIDINKASVSDLIEIPGMDISTANEILEYRNRSGRIFSLAELNSIAGIGKNTIAKIKIFLKVENDINSIDKITQPELFSLQFRNRISSDLQQKDGFIRNKFAGNNLKTYNRLKIKYNHYRAGITLDKDPGEKSYNDLFSVHLSINNFGIIDKVIIGDYTAEFGQGLALWSPYSFSKSTDAIYPVKKKPHQLREYTSTDENKFFRGVGTNLNFKGYNISLFYSRNNIDANITAPSGYILSTPISGYHRTASEIQEKNSANEKTFGGMLNISMFGKMNLGLLYFYSEFSNNFLPNSIFDLKGRNFNFYSFAYDIYIKDINLFGEAAYNGKSLATITNLEISVTNNFSFISSIRSYPRNYFNLHSFGFGEQTNTQNEFGIYNGIKIRTRIGLFNLYYDQFRFPYASYYSDLPAAGDEFLINYSVSPLQKLITTLKYKVENKDVNTKLGESVQIYNREKSSFRFELEYSLSNEIELKSRVEISKYKIDDINISENGFLIFQGLKFTPTKNLYINGRIIFFRTDSFNSAIYEFENDLDGTYSITGLSGQGIKWYWLIKYRLLEMLRLSVKYSEIYKPAEKSLGSGYTEINGNFDNQLSAQIEWDL